MKRLCVALGLLSAVAALAAPALSQTAAARAAAKPAPSGEGVRWFDGEVDAAFAQARRENRPLFLYWGAVWCPPCNQVKSTVFNRQDFVERSRLFIPVYIDGDAPAAQRLGARFKVSGYPTMILFRPDGSEVTRLPGEVDPQHYMQVLALGMNATRPVRDLLAIADGGKGTLSAAEWRLLAYYAWETDEQALVPRSQLPAMLARLARRVPAASGDAALRLQLKALGAAATAPENNRPALDRAAGLKQLQAVVADPVLVRDHFSALVHAAADIARLLTAAGSAERAQLVAAMDRAFARAATEIRMSQSDRLTATLARVQLAQKAHPGGGPSAVSAPLRETARAEAARADRETADRYERQSVISTAAYLLREAGLMEESDALLRRELPRSPAPYYFMLSLASNAKQRGDTAAALDWYRRGYETSVGPATRLQWGATYLRNLIDLAPEDAARIEQAARAILGELEPKPETFHARNLSVLNRMGKALVDWADQFGQQAALSRLRAQHGELCGRLPSGISEKTACARVLAAAAPPG